MARKPKEREVIQDTNVQEAAGEAGGSISYQDGKYAVEVTSLPAASLLVLAQSGLNHYLGNRVTSYAAGLKAKMVKAEDGTESRQHSDEEVAESAEAKRAELWSKLLSGEVERPAGGQSAVSPLEAMMWRVATEFATAALRAKGAKLPTGDKVIEIGGESYTRDGVIRLMLARREAAITAEAERRLDTTAGAVEF